MRFVHAENEWQDDGQAGNTAESRQDAHDHAKHSSQE